METKKIIALLSYLKNEKAETEIKNMDIIDDTILRIDGWDYYVLTDEEREEIFKEQQQALWDDMGLESYSSSFVHEIINYCLDENDLEYLEQNEFCYYDEENDVNISIAEAEGYANYVEYTYEQHGTKEATKVINDYNLLDIDALCYRVAMWDGYAPTLARYDGEEIECGEYYAYLIG